MTDSDQSWKQLCQIAVKGAEYNSRERQPHPKCLPETRVEFLAHINGLLDDEQGSRIIWIHGIAGVGKSAVAFTIADRMRRLKVTEERPNEKRLAGTFFFSRKYTNRCMTGYFFATLVCQLATNFPSIRGDVSVAINNNPSLLDPDKPLPVQMEALFLEPLRRLQPRLHTHPPIVFVIDALDECTSEGETTDLVSLLGQALRDPGLPVIHILLTSRPEAHLRKSMQEVDMRPLVHEIPVKISGAGVTRIISLDGVDVDSDICIFLQDSFETLRGRYPDFPQPTQRVLERLASRAGRRFIVASTMMKFIDDGYNDPHDRLQLMLDLTSELLPGTEVFKLYDRIISTCANPPRVYQHLSIVATLANPLPMAQISKLLGPGEGKDAKEALVQLRSLVDIPTNPELPVGIYHSSVHDYVSNPHRSQEGGQWITPAHSVLACASFRLMKFHIPESMGLLDALSGLSKHHQAIKSQDLRSLLHLSEVISISAMPLYVLRVLVWLWGDRSPQLRSWLSTMNGRDWLNTQEGVHWLEAQGLDWLQTQEGGEWLAWRGASWLKTQSGKDWLSSQNGWDWLWTHNGHHWLDDNKAWLRSSDAQTWFDSPGGKDWSSSHRLEWLSYPQHWYWLQSLDGNKWLRSESGSLWLQSESGRLWLNSKEGNGWRQSESGNKWLRSESGSLWLSSKEGNNWLQSSSGNHWLSILKGGMLTPKDADDLQKNLKFLLTIRDYRDESRTRRLCEGWLQTPDGANCLETAIRGDWLSTEGEKWWLRTASGRDWMDTQSGRQWLTTPGNIWLYKYPWTLSQSGREWLQAERMSKSSSVTIMDKHMLRNESIKQWLFTSEVLQTESGQEWLQTESGHKWLQTESGREWLQTESGHKWLQTESGKEWLMTWSGKNWLHDKNGQYWLRTESGQGWLQTKGGQEWLENRRSEEAWWLKMQFKNETPMTEDQREWLETSDGQWTAQKWLETKDAQMWLQIKSGEEWLGTEDGREWLQTDGGQVWVCEKGASWLRTKSGEEWIESESTRSSIDWLSPELAEEWLRTETGRNWLKTESGRNWIEVEDGEDWLDSQSGHEWVQTRDGQQWLDTESGQLRVPRKWLDTQSGKEWLQSPSGYHWQRSHHARKLQFWFDDFLETREAITNFIIIPAFQALPPFRAIEQFERLPNFLKFPAFLALTPQDTSLASECEEDTSLASECEEDTDIMMDVEVIHAMKAFVSFTDEARERIESQTTSGALSYACQNWAMHLSRAPNRRDEKLDHLFDVFWNKHILSWLERQWILKGLRSCLPVLSEAQTVIAKKLAESS